jgi:hypothetical protein
MSTRTTNTKLPSFLTKELISLLKVLTADYRRQTACRCAVRIAREKDSYYTACEDVIYFGTDDAKGFTEGGRLDLKGAIMVSYLLAHEFGHAILNQPGSEYTAAMAKYLVGDINFKARRKTVQNMHATLNVPVTPYVLDYLSGRTEAVWLNYKSCLKLFPKDQRAGRISNFEVGEFFAELNAAILLQNLRLNWQHPLRPGILAAIQTRNWYRDEIPKQCPEVQDIVGFLRSNLGHQEEPPALQRFRRLFPFNTFSTTPIPHQAAQKTVYVEF